MPTIPPRRFVAHPFAYRQEIDVAITGLSNLGLGVGRVRSGEVDGWVVMVPFALPGETVRARIWRNHANYSLADLVEVRVAAAERVTPVCPLFGACGGCQYQHLDYAAQLRCKTQHVAEVLQRIAGAAFAVQPARPSPRQYGYRSKLTPHHPRPQPGWALDIGFLRHDRRQIVDVPHCPLATAALNTALAKARQRLQDKASTPRRGATLLLRDTGTQIVDDPQAIAEETVGTLRYRYVAGEFFQTNPFLLPELVDYVVAQARHGARYVVDAYCGVGLFSLAAARQVEAVTGIELAAAAIAQAQANAAANGISNCHFVAGDAAEIFAAVSYPGDQTCVLIDPPRRGCDAAFLAQLLGFRPRRIVYVSCDPATQARDLRNLLAADYAVLDVQPFDMFPQTRHIENVITLEDVTATRR